jgi:hypothetical protein
MGFQEKRHVQGNFATWKNQLVVLAKQLSVGVLTRQWSTFDNELALTVTKAPQHSTNNAHHNWSFMVLWVIW